MTYDAAKITQNTVKLMQKYRKLIGMIVPTQLKAVFNFLNTFAEYKFRLLNVILLWLSP